jgi:2-polyprenyl-3-methyl-5-hydroxy-6-metoxy-1,4-benzoquinol methylase
MGEKMKFVENREEIILKYARNKEVLDCGCVERLPPGPHWLHGKLVEVSKSVLGVDLWKEGVEKLRAMGYNVIWGDVTTMNLRRKFDVIVAGEILEHLPNQGLFLKNMKRHLKKKGVLILTTPNALAFPYQWIELITWNLRWGKVKSRKWNLGPHVVFHVPDTLWALAETHGFEIELWGCGGNPPKRGLRRVIRNLFCKVFPQFSSSLLAVLRPRASRF